MRGYVELHCKSNFSFLEGASHADELVEQAISLGYRGLSISDRNTLAGIVRAHTVAKEHQFQLVIGAEIHPMDGPPVLLWPTDRAAYGRLSRLISLGRLRSEKGICQIFWNDIAEYADGMLGGILLRQPSDDWMSTHIETHRMLARYEEDMEISSADFASISDALLDGDVILDPGGRGSRRADDVARQEPRRPGDLLPCLFDPKDDSIWLNWLGHFRDIFGDRGYLLCSLMRGVDDHAKLARFIHFEKQSKVPIVATGDVHYHIAERMILHDCLAAVAAGTTIEEVRHQRPAGSQYGMQKVSDIERRFAAYPAAIDRTLEIASRCSFSLDELKYEYPTELAPDGQRPIDFLKRLAWEGAKKRYSEGVSQRTIGMLKHEIELIEELHYEAYFLTVWDLVRFARSRGILCQGRGSAANSIVCYCLGVTSVDPAQMDLLFERFISRERNEAPDIDVDFEHQRREEVLQYIYEKYGRHRAGMTATVIRYRIRSAVRDCGKAIGLSLDRIDALSKIVDGRSGDDGLAAKCAQIGLDPASETGKRFLYLVQNLVGFPRHLSQHVGGMVMTQGALCELCPIENAAMDGRTVIQWDKDDLDELGILKVDCLSLGMLSAIHRCFDFVEKHHDRQCTLANIAHDDPNVYDMICKADTIGVFQIESRAQMSMLPRLRPRTYYDLVIEVAIVRPGPIQGQMVHPYLKARQSGIQPPYPSKEIEQVLSKTMGVPIFQEQAMRLAVVAAGFTPGEADQLRRAMAAWRRPGVIDRFRQKLIDGMAERGLDALFAERVFTQIRGFGEYGFPESHAASFALLVYVSAWLKHYYPAAFCASILNSLPMGFYGPSQLVQDARKHGVIVRSVDINHSDWDCTLEKIIPRPKPSSVCNDVALRMGLRLIRGLPQEVAANILEARSNKPYRDLADVVRRTRLGQAMMTRLADAGALGSLAGDRRAALWQSMAQEKSAQSLPLFEAQGVDDDEPVPEQLTRMNRLEEVYADYETVGLSLQGHPMDFVRKGLDAAKVTAAADLPLKRNGQYIRVAGLVVLRQRPGTAKGITFVTLEDETGSMNLVIRSETWKQFYMICKRSNAWLVHGVLEMREGIIHILVGRVEDLNETLKGIEIKSRDFR